MNLEDLMRRADVWRAGEIPPASGFSTGFETLDCALPGGGWPRSGLTEILSATPGIGALRLVLPTLARLSHGGHWIIWVCPPHIPYSPALSQYGMDLAQVLIVDLPEQVNSSKDQTLWAYEQALRFPDCGAALLWTEDAADLRFRRLQLAAEAGRTWGIVFRPERFRTYPSPAPLRLALSTCRETEAAAERRDALQVTIIKARGGQGGTRCRIELGEPEKGTAI
jgi:hypothetical protein